MRVPLSKLPPIFIEIRQPGDKGDFHIGVYDGKTHTKITENRLSEDLSYLEYIYTARLLENSFIPNVEQNPEFKQQLRFRQDDLIRYGQSLYRDLFGADDRFKKYIEKQPHLQGGAQIILRLHSTASELWNIPWEYMHDGNCFLGIQPQFPIMRNLLDARLERDNLDLRTLPCPLRILMVISHPKDSGVPLNIDTEMAMIRRAVQSAEASGRIEIDFVEEGTLENLDRALRDGDYHALHFSGHGSVAPQGSFLAMENPDGYTMPVFLWQLLPLIQRSENLRFIFLSACRAGMIAATQATSGIATGLLQAVPAVLAMQFSIKDYSASVLAEAFYGSLGRGQTLEEALHISRQALHKSNPMLGDWGIPALYTHKPNIRLLDTKAELPAVRQRRIFDLSALPTFDPFVGRHEEQRKIRSSLTNNTIHSIYLWGMAGVGKSALVRQVLARPGQRDIIDDVLVLRCDKVELAQLVTQISKWIRTHFPETSQCLKDNTLSPAQRIEAVARMVRGKRLILVLDGLDRVMQLQEDYHGEFPHPTLTDYFKALASASWSILTIFTSRWRWSQFAELPEEHCFEIHLPELLFVDVQFLLHNLTHLKSANAEAVNNFFDNVGGHPITMHYTNAYIGKNPQRDPLNDPTLAKRLATWWHMSFLGDIFQRVKPTEREALRLLSVRGTYFNPQDVQLLVNLPTIEDAERIMVSWELLSLAYFVDTDEDDTPWYIIPKLVRTYVISSLKPEKLARSHAEVARVMQHHFFLAANERSGAEADSKDEFRTVLKDIEMLPRRTGGGTDIRYVHLVGMWHHHLREAGDHKRANEIALVLLPSLWTLHAYSAGRELVKTLKEKLTDKDKNEGALITRFWEASYAMEAGESKEALSQFQALEKSVRQVKSSRLLPQILMRQGEIYRSQGNHAQAKRLWRSAMELYQRPMDVIGLSHVMLYLGENAYFHGDNAEALRAIDDGLNLLSKTDRINVNLHVLGGLYLYRGHIFRRAQEDVNALDCYSRALNIAEQLGDYHLIGKSLESFGYTYGLLRQYDLAARYLLQAVDLYEKIDDKTSLAVALARLAQVYDYKGSIGEAQVFCERALQFALQHAPAAIKQTEDLRNQLRRKRPR